MSMVILKTVALRKQNARPIREVYRDLLTIVSKQGGESSVGKHQSSCTVDHHKQRAYVIEDGFQKVRGCSFRKQDSVSPHTADSSEAILVALGLRRSQPAQVQRSETAVHARLLRR